MKMIQTDVVRKGESEDYYRGYEDGKRDAFKREKRKYKWKESEE